MDFNEWVKGDGPVWGAAASVRTAAATALLRLGIDGQSVLRVDPPDTDAAYLYVTADEGLVRFTVAQAHGDPWAMEVELIPWHDVEGLRLVGRIRQEFRGGASFDDEWTVSADRPEVAAHTLDGSARRADAEAIAFWADCLRRSIAAKRWPISNHALERSLIASPPDEAGR
jgi:hypothetical protein